MSAGPAPASLIRSAIAKRSAVDQARRSSRVIEAGLGTVSVDRIEVRFDADLIRNIINNRQGRLLVLAQKPSGLL